MPTFVAAIDRYREDYTDGDDSERNYLIIQAARDTGTVQYKLQNATSLLVSDSPVTKICPHELASTIHCIVWSFFSLQQAKTSNSQIHRVTERTVCT